MNDVSVQLASASLINDFHDVLRQSAERERLPVETHIRFRWYATPDFLVRYVRVATDEHDGDVLVDLAFALAGIDTVDSRRHPNIQNDGIERQSACNCIGNDCYCVPALVAGDQFELRLAPVLCVWAKQVG